MGKFCFRKLHISLLICLLMAVAGANAQGIYNTTSWRFSNPKQFGITILDVDYLDNNNVLAVGGDGGICKSTDGGTNWGYGIFTYVNAAGVRTKASFNDVHYVNGTVAYAVGDRGLMAKTTDGGSSWSFVTTPLWANTKNINACWFLDANRGYIGGEPNNAVDSLPRLYVTQNGGATWDSITPPAVNGVSRVGYINNPNIPSVLWPVDSKLKAIYRIEFINDSTGYVTGSNSYGVTLFPSVSARATSATVCTPTTGSLTSGSMAAGMLWKFKSGVLTDYSFTKERLGYTGINTNTVNCTTTYGTVTPVTQQYRAMNIINDSTVVLMSFNNNTVVKVKTGINDSTANVNAPGVFEKGKYEVLNFPFPPTQGPNAGPPIPPVQTLLASNPYHMIRNSSGTLMTGTFNNIGGPGYLWTSTDTGRNWVRNNLYPQGRNWTPVANAPALDLAPNGKLLALGTNGMVGDSVPGGTWQSNYVTTPVGASYEKMEFADCANGIAAGGSFITVTEDGGKTWIDKQRPDFASSFVNINGLAYPNTSKCFIAVSNGIVYRSLDRATTFDPVYVGSNVQMRDIAAIGNDTVWAVGASISSVPAASRTSQLYRSINGGNSWTAYSPWYVGQTGTPLTHTIISEIEFPSRNIGYAAGNRDTVWKTTDGGLTWTKLPVPTPGVTPQITYTDMFALDNNTVFLTGNGFPRKVVLKTTDGGNTWQDITSNIPTIYPVGNMNGVMFHDANNGYVVGPGGALLVTNNGGTSWTLDYAPTPSLFSAMAFSPRKVPAGTTIQNRRLFVVGPNVSGAPIMEYGNPANLNVSSTETLVRPTCTTTNGGSITINATGSIAPYTYSINGGPFQSSNSFSGLSAGNYVIRIKSNACDSLTKTVNLLFDDNLTLTTNNDTSVCAGAPVQMQATSSATGYSWSPSAGLSNATIANPVATVNSATTYTVTATLGSCVRTRSVNISIRPNPIVNAGPDRTIVSGDVIQLQGVGSLSGIQSIAWSPTTGITGGINTYTPTVAPTTTITYTMTVRNNDNCTSTDNVLVTVIPYCVKVMEAFTPNGDGINDRWLVTNGAACTNQIIALVYNRYGNLVYENRGYQNNWDGTYKGKPVPDGTYYYVVTYKLINGREYTLKGDVTILR